MWTKEAPKEPGFYWIRSPLPLTDTMEFCIVNIWPGRENGPFAAYPGSDFRIPVSEVPSNVEWWPEPICPPGGLIHPLKQHEAQAWVVADLKDHLPGRTRADRIFTRLTDPLSLIEVGDLVNGLLGLATAYRLRIEAFRQAREKRKLAGMRIETTAPSFGWSKAEAQRAAGLRTQPKPVVPYAAAHLYSDRWRDAGKALGIEKPASKQYSGPNWEGVITKMFAGNPWGLLLCTVIAEDLPASNNTWKSKGSRDAFSTLAGMYKVDLAEISREFQKQDRELIKGMRERAEAKKAAEAKPKKEKKAKAEKVAKKAKAKKGA